MSLKSFIDGIEQTKRQEYLAHLKEMDDAAEQERPEIVEKLKTNCPLFYAENQEAIDSAPSGWVYNDNRGTINGTYGSKGIVIENLLFFIHKAADGERLGVTDSKPHKHVRTGRTIPLGCQDVDIRLSDLLREWIA